MSSGKMMLGVLAGFAAGALLGVLLAPEKGTETRKKLAKLGDDYAEDLTDKFNQLRETITGRLDSVRDEGMNIVEKSKSKLEDVKNHVRSTTKSSDSGSSSGQDKWSSQNG